jgi:hypothetical protein
MGVSPATSSSAARSGLASKRVLNMGVLWSKILRDIWAIKAYLQIVLIIGIGAAAIGMILSTRAGRIRDGGYLDKRRPGHDQPVRLPAASEEDVYALRRVEGVKEIEGYSNSTIEWRLNPEEEWKQGGLTARADYNDQKLNTLELVSGPWPHEKVLAIDDGSDTFFGIPLGGTVYLRVNDRVVKVRTEGVVYNIWSPPAYFAARPSLRHSRLLRGPGRQHGFQPHRCLSG